MNEIRHKGISPADEAKSWQGGGVKILRTEHRGLWDSFFITGAGWALLIPKEHCPSEITGQLVTWLADMPKIGESKWVAKGCGPQDIPEGDKAIDLSRYTAGTYDDRQGHALPICTATNALVQYSGSNLAAAFPWMPLPWSRPAQTLVFWTQRPVSPAGRTRTHRVFSGFVTMRTIFRRMYGMPQHGSPRRNIKEVFLWLKSPELPAKKSKLRIALAGVSGGGKTLGALLLASGLTGGDFSKVCLDRYRAPAR